MYELVQKNKPVVRILNAWVDYNTYQLHGIVMDYPENHMTVTNAVVNGREISSSKIIKYDPIENTIETRRTIYRIISWKRKPSA
jgi:hypothetical protein